MKLNVTHILVEVSNHTRLLQSSLKFRGHKFFHKGEFWINNFLVVLRRLLWFHVYPYSWFAEIASLCTVFRHWELLQCPFMTLCSQAIGLASKGAIGSRKKNYMTSTSDNNRPLSTDEPPLNCSWYWTFMCSVWSAFSNSMIFYHFNVFLFYDSLPSDICFKCQESWQVDRYFDAFQFLLYFKPAERHLFSIVISAQKSLPIFRDHS